VFLAFTTSSRLYRESLLAGKQHNLQSALNKGTFDMKPCLGRPSDCSCKQALAFVWQAT